jgi:putative membrane protein
MTLTTLAAVPAFLAYFIASLLLLAGFLTLYCAILPGREWDRIRAGNAAAALSLAGAAFGFSLPLAAAIMHADSLADMALWAGISLLVQLGAFAAMHLLRRDVAASIGRGEMAEAILLAAGSVVLGLLNAACMTP